LTSDANALKRRAGRRIGPADDIAGVFAFLPSGQTRSVTGQKITWRRPCYVTQAGFEAWWNPCPSRVTRRAPLPKFAHLFKTNHLNRSQIPRAEEPPARRRMMELECKPGATLPRRKNPTLSDTSETHLKNPVTDPAILQNKAMFSS
jgi:hypothetical protein